MKGKGRRKGRMKSQQRPPEVASAAAAVAVEAVLKAEAAQLPLAPVMLLVVLFAAVLLTSLFSKSAGCGSAAYWAIQWAVAPVLLAVWWYSRRMIVRKTALKRDAHVDFHGEVRWTSSNSIIFPAICTLAGGSCAGCSSAVNSTLRHGQVPRAVVSMGIEGSMTPLNCGITSL
jgi:hypothetical protein